MIELTSPLIHGRHQSWGITRRLAIEGKWFNIAKVTSQTFGNSEGPQQEFYESIGLKGHNGIDIVSYDNEPVLASHDGIVMWEGADTSGGIGIILWDEKQYKTIYWHNRENLVNKGDKVKQGDTIALGDSSGYSTGTHLHFGLKETDKLGNTINLDNGYKGGINPLNYAVDAKMNRLIKFKGINEVYEEVESFKLEHLETPLTLTSYKNDRQIVELPVSDMEQYEKIGVRVRFLPTSL